jgi:hypothetical protein
MQPVVAGILMGPAVLDASGNEGEASHVQRDGHPLLPRDVTRLSVERPIAPIRQPRSAARYRVSQASRRTVGDFLDHRAHHHTSR